MNAPVIATSEGALHRHPSIVARDIARARAVARLGLHVVGADDISEVKVGTGYYALASLEGRCVESTYCAPSETPLAALNALIARLAEIQWTAFARGGR